MHPGYAISDKRMKKVLVTFLLLLAAAIALWAQVTQPIFPVDNKNAELRVDPQRLRDHVEMLSETFYPRNEENAENLARVAMYIKKVFEEIGVDVSLQTFKTNGREYSNVIASVGPDTEERIIVGAHYDTAGALPGADDNASGVAGLLELARLLKDTPLPLRVDLAAYTLEEPPYFRNEQMGSAHHVKLLQEQGARVRMMLALEMIGYFSDEPGSQWYPLPGMYLSYPRVGNYIAVVGKFFGGANVRTIKRAMREASPLPVYSLNAPSSVPGVDFSDHLNFWKAGMPAVMITDTAFYRNAEYHSPGDTADRLDYTRMAMVVQGVYAAVLALADET